MPAKRKVEELLKEAIPKEVGVEYDVPPVRVKLTWAQKRVLAKLSR